MAKPKVLFAVSLGVALAAACGGSTDNGVGSGGNDAGSSNDASTGGDVGAGGDGNGGGGDSATGNDTGSGGGPVTCGNGPGAQTCSGATPDCCIQGGGGGGGDAGGGGPTFTCVASAADCQGGATLACTASSCISPDVCCGTGGQGQPFTTACSGSCATGSYQLCTGMGQGTCPAGDRCRNVGGGIRVCVQGGGPGDGGGPPNDAGPQPDGSTTLDAGSPD